MIIRMTASWSSKMQSMAGRELSQNVAWNVIHRIEREITKQHEEENDACRLGAWGFPWRRNAKVFLMHVFKPASILFSHMAALCNSLY